MGARRAPLAASPDPSQRRSPKRPLKQLCSTSIIRDEHIASLSLDLKETERYALLRDALGANDADVWIEKASRLVSIAKRRLEAIQQEITSFNTEVALASRRIDEVRAALVAEESMAEVVERLRTFANTAAAPDRLAGPAREQLAATIAQVETVQRLADRWADVNVERARMDLLTQAEAAARSDREVATTALAAIPLRGETSPASTLATEAQDLIALVALGRKLGLKDGACPLCATGQSEAAFHHGMAVAEAIARRLDDEAAREAERQQARQSAEARLAAAERRAEAAAAAAERFNALNIVPSPAYRSPR